MNKEILNACKELAKHISNDDRLKKLDEAKKAYDECKEIKNLMAEYNVQQIALAEEYKKDTLDQDFIGVINKRIEELYHIISEHPVMKDYIAAQDEVNLLMNEVNTEINFFITGERPCSHDCSSCASKCAEQH